MKKLITLILATVALLIAVPAAPASACQPGQCGITDGPSNVDFDNDSYGCIFNYDTLRWTNPADWDLWGQVVDHYVEIRYTASGYSDEWLSFNPVNTGSAETFLEVDATPSPIGVPFDLRVLAVIDIGGPTNIISAWSPITSWMNCLD
jgi:hypothetical protein